MSELRWNPLLGNWTLVNKKRQNRPNLKSDGCPFCPGSEKIPNDYDVLLYPNDFPVMKTNPDTPSKINSKVYKTQESYGKCDVVLYSSDHYKHLTDLKKNHLIKIVDVITQRMKENYKDEKIKFIMPFENRGTEVGVTMHHPHGQIYSYGHIPLKVETEINNFKKYHIENKSCMLCDLIDEEQNFNQRVIFQDEHFICILPHFTDYPFGIFLLPKKHRSCLTMLNEIERESLAVSLKKVAGMFDHIYKKDFPYMMVFHGKAHNTDEDELLEKSCHFHIEFYPPLRSKNAIKFYASSEMGAWAACNVAEVEDSSKVLKRALLDHLQTTNETELLEYLENEFTNFFKSTLNDNDIKYFRAPARINLIGEHIDYTGGKVLPAAIDLYCYSVVSFRDDQIIKVYSLNYDETVEIIPNELGDKSNKWSDYLIGILLELQHKNLKVDKGLNIYLYSQIPMGSGVSSSAALEVLFTYTLNSLFQFNMSLQDISLLSQKAEHNFIQVKCGIMDQFACAHGKENNAIYLNCESLEFEYIKGSLENYNFLLIDSNKPRELSSSKYNERRDESFKVLSILKDNKVIKENITEITHLSYEKFENLFEGKTLFKRFKHILSENKRVLDFCDSYKKNQIDELSKILNESHLSLKNDFEVSCDELDLLFEITQNNIDLLGGRMIGAGFGGCFLVLVKSQNIHETIKKVKEEYFRKSKLECDVYKVSIVDGVKEVIR